MQGLMNSQFTELAGGMQYVKYVIKQVSDK